MKPRPEVVDTVFTEACKDGEGHDFWGYLKCRQCGKELGSPNDEIARLTLDIETLNTVMIAAAEEINKHWDAHCDADGYGPVNLVRRLERGIPSEYGYTAGAFARLQAENERLTKEHTRTEIDAAWESAIHNAKRAEKAATDLAAALKTIELVREWAEVHGNRNHPPICKGLK